MTEKRYIVDVDEAIIDTKTNREYTTWDISGVEDICDKLNNLTEENEQLKQFPVKLENRIQKLQEDLQKLTEMDKSDLNPQAIEDMITVISISLNALIEFKKELQE